MLCLVLKGDPADCKAHWVRPASACSNTLSTLVTPPNSHPLQEQKPCLCTSAAAIRQPDGITSMLESHGSLTFLE